jgi:hypothetical protein
MAAAPAITSHLLHLSAPAHSHMQIRVRGFRLISFLIHVQKQPQRYMEYPDCIAEILVERKLAGETEMLGEKAPQCHSVHHKSGRHL